MPDLYYPPVSFTDPDLFRQLLRMNLIDFDLGRHDARPMNAKVEMRQADYVHATKLDTQYPLRVLRRAADVARDSTSYVALIYQQTGRMVYQDRSHDVTVGPGEILVAHTAKPHELIAPDRIQNLVMLIPTDCFHARFPESDCSGGGLHLRSDTNTVAILAGCLDTLAEKVFPRTEESAAPAIDLVMDILGAALLDQRESTDPQTLLFKRITRFMNRELKDGSLTPAVIAQAQGISVRYLHLLFSRRGMTVGGWIRSRRLEACRQALSDPRQQRSVTEVALEWGFYDAAHFSKAFKSAYGANPSAFRLLNRGAIRLP